MAEDVMGPRREVTTITMLYRHDMPSNSYLNSSIYTPSELDRGGSLLQRTVATADTVTSQSAENKSWENTLQ